MADPTPTPKPTQNFHMYARDLAASGGRAVDPYARGEFDSQEDERRALELLYRMYGSQPDALPVLSSAREQYNSYGGGETFPGDELYRLLEQTLGRGGFGAPPRTGVSGGGDYVNTSASKKKQGEIALIEEDMDNPDAYAERKQKEREEEERRKKAEEERKRRGR